MPTRRRIVYRQVEPTEWDAVAVVMGLVVGAACVLLLLAALMAGIVAVAAHWCRTFAC